ncbi:uncharacterized protein FIBRA_07788 [Fibroporia radiculosa]|uniref:Uncharacterized protein n=1 Tax=Fibroporia radiculosa TaxID=599839 RepID=J4IC03_9APHY|nr:uncharacterized protein FIBRA_07788 [Fibroporia radiculosa]CCM05561.1 predicted protein [Fibroporia radiculosa]
MSEDEEELRSVRDELLAVGETIAQIEARYTAALTRSLERTRRLEARVVDLEAQLALSSSELQRLRAENVDLRRSSQAGSHRTTNERESAAGTNSQSQILDTKGKAVARRAPSTEPLSPVSDIDLRGSSAHATAAHRQRRQAGTRSARPQPLKIADPSSPSASADIQPPPRQTTPLPESPGAWYIEYLNPPATATNSAGPMSYADLQSLLGLDDETMICIESLGWMDDPCMRIHIHNNLIFVTRALFLEGPSGTYLVNWGRQEVNRNVKRYLVEGMNRPAASLFHLFFNPQTQRGLVEAWFYLGAHEMTAVELGSAWHSSWLHKEEKKVLCAELMQRWNSRMDGRDVARMIEERELEQCTIQLKHEGQEDATAAFLEEVLRG